MKARVLRVKPEPVIALEPDGEGDRRVLEALVKAGALSIETFRPVGRGFEDGCLDLIAVRPATPETVARVREAAHG